MPSKGGNDPKLEEESMQAGRPEIRVSVDWLRYTIPYTDGSKWREAVIAALPPDERIHVTGETLPNARGYDMCVGCSVGRVHVHSKRVEQGIGVEFTGSECVQLYGMGLDWQKLWNHIEAQRGRITTIHFAIDVINYNADHAELYDALDAGKATTHARTKHMFAGGAIGDGRTEGTTYVGKSSSDRQLRVYNKAAERGIEADWTRIELVVKGKRARAILDTLQTVKWSTVARSMIAEYLKWDGCEWWQAATTGNVIAMPPVVRQTSNTHKWLMGQCLTAFKREIMEGDPEASERLAGSYEAVIQWWRSANSHSTP